MTNKTIQEGRELIATKATLYRDGVEQERLIQVWYPLEPSGTIILGRGEHLASDFTRLKNSLVSNVARNCEIVFETH